jgi:hypothetical protein
MEEADELSPPASPRSPPTGGERNRSKSQCHSSPDRRRSQLGRRPRSAVTIRAPAALAKSSKSAATKPHKQHRRPSSLPNATISLVIVTRFVRLLGCRCGDVESRQKQTPNRTSRAKCAPELLQVLKERAERPALNSLARWIATQRRKSEAVKPRPTPFRSIVISSLPVLPLVSK